MQAVVLAGGKGQRLRPYTTVLPKPLMPVGNEPILELLVKQLRFHGVSEVILAVGYLNHLIRAFFAEGQRHSLKISYSEEKEALGTAGPLKLIYDRLDDNFLVLNGDLLTTLNFQRLFSTHIQTGSAATIGVFQRQQPIDFGVLDVDKDNLLSNYIEKPIHKLTVSMGVNALNKHSIQGILERNNYLDIPNLMMELLKEQKKVYCYRENCLWLDIGRVDDYEQAHQIFEENRNQFLPFER